MAKQDIRWIQRFNNFNKSLKSLINSVEEFNIDEEDEVIKVGMIKFFEMTYELAWNTIKDYYEEQGETDIQGSKDAFKLAYSRGLISDSKAWFSMIDSRKLSVHTYNENTADQIAEEIVHSYTSLFIQLQTRLQIEKIEQQKLGSQGSLPLE